MNKNRLPLKNIFLRTIESNFFKKNGSIPFLEYYPTLLDLDLVNYITKLKRQYTIDANQDGITRSLNKKNNSQFEGDLAELIVTKWLIKSKLNLSDIKWWDVERPSFEYDSSTEYDVKYKNIRMNVKASFYKRPYPIEDIFNTDPNIGIDYIAGYVNGIKTKNSPYDIAVRVIYSFGLNYKKKSYIDYNGAKDKDFFYKALTAPNESERLRCYLVGFATFDFLNDPANYYMKKMNQRNAEFKAVELYKGQSILDLCNWLKYNSK